MTDENQGQSQVSMPQYQCHKKVYALKIKEVVKHAHPDPNYDDAEFEASDQFDGAHLMPEDDRYAPIPVSANWYHSHKPTAPGYYVVYDDGYTSYSLVQAFERGYTLIHAPHPPREDKNASD